MSRRLLFLSALLFALCSVSAVAQDHPNDARGFAPDRVFDFHDIDHVNLFNGNLAIAIPIGPAYNANAKLSYQLHLVYNSHVWKFVAGDTSTGAVPLRTFNAGLGWSLSLGRLVDAPDIENGYATWAFETPDGAQHTLYPAAPSTTSPAYSRDSSFYRYTETGSAQTVEAPDGTIYVFSSTLVGTRLTTIKNHLTNEVDIAYTTPSGWVEQWAITDGEREIDAYFGGTTNAPVLDHIDFPAFGGGSNKNTYSFITTIASVPAPTGETYPGTPTDEPLLIEVRMPPVGASSAKYQFQLADGTPGYELSSRNTAGVLKRLVLPTLGSIQWVYGTLGFPRTDNLPPGKSPAVTKPVMVTQRSTYDAAAHLLGTWSYGRGFSNRESCYVSNGLCNNSADPGPCYPHRQMTAYVTPPSTDASSATATTVTYFSIYDSATDLCPISAGWSDAEYGAPITHYVQSQATGRHTTAGDHGFLSSEIFTGFGCAVAPPAIPPQGALDPSCAGTRQREEYVKFASDATSGQEANRRTSHSATFFDDFDNSGNGTGCVGGHTACFSATSFLNYDNYGHYRQTSTDGNFDGNNFKTSFTNYYGTLDGNSDWILTPFSEQCTVYDSPDSPFRTTAAQSCADLTGGIVSTTAFNRGSGLLTSQRTLSAAVGAPPTTIVQSSNDLLANLSYGSSGYLKEQDFFGGDAQPLSPMPATPAYEIDYTNQFTALGRLRKRTGQYISNVGSKTPVLTIVDEDYDPSTGLPSHSRDSAGLQTAYSYDTRWRISSISPPGEAATTVSYTDATNTASFAGAAVTTTRTSSGPSSTGSVTATYVYDPFGQLVTQKALMFDSMTSVVTMVYDVLGRKTSVSTAAADPGTNAPLTTYGSFDAFGNPTLITGPDGSSRSVYRGGSRVVRSIVDHVAISGSGSGGLSVETDETYDRFGRLLQVTEPSGSTTPITTSYGYDVADHLTSVNMTGPENTIQTRSFTFDNRGFLTAEQHPEIGTAGNGSVVYSSFDARGHAAQKAIGSGTNWVTQTFLFDAAERPLSLTNGTDGSSRTFTYATTNDPTVCTGECDAKAGKLVTATRTNADLNFRHDFGNVTVTENYAYKGVGGRISSCSTAVSSTSGFTGDTFLYKQDFNDLGLLHSMTYPCRATSGACSDSTKEVDYQYANGHLTAVNNPTGTAWASSLTYHPNGMMHTVIHGTGSTAITDTTSIAADNMPRPSEIVTTNTADVTLWKTGSYSYDGAGNISQIGTDGGNSYAYDAVGRLTHSVENTVTNNYTYDSFGNRLTMMARYCSPTTNGTSRCFDSVSIPWTYAGTTNHSRSLRYDAVGNVINDNHRLFSYDGLGMPAEVAYTRRDFRYLYTADDERIALVERVTDSNNVTRNRTTWSLRAPGNQLLRQYSDDSTSGTRVVTWKEDEIWRGPALLAKDSPTGITHYSLDHLGSPRLLTNGNGQVLGTRTYAAFGGGGTSDGGALQFTGQERDAANVGAPIDLPDYFHARLYDVGSGRFLSVDAHTGHPERPQSWNRYAYARNNPLVLIDADGQDVDVAPGLRGAYYSGMVRSPTLLLQHIRMSRNHNVMWHIRSSGKEAPPGSQAYSRFGNYKFQGGKIVGFEATSYIPSGGDRRVASLIGHEGGHGEEILDTGMTLEQRYNLKDPSVHKNTQTSDYNNSYESDFADDLGKTVDLEIASFKAESNDTKPSGIAVQSAEETERWMFSDSFGTRIEVTYPSPP